jgi:hypothetical protein
LFDAAVSKLSKFGGDVGFFWLNYVDPLLELYPDTRFVCLRRDREKTADSLARRMIGRRHFALHVLYRDETGRLHAPTMFPEYNGQPIREAAGLYWDEYYSRAEDVEKKHPECFRIFNTEAVLNEESVQREMLEFTGSDREPDIGIRSEDVKGFNELGNMIAEVVERVVSEKDIREGSRITITPEYGHRLGILAAAVGISEHPEDPIVLAFNRIEDGRPLQFGP